MQNNHHYGFIFDMDGTLIDNMPFHTHIWVSYLAELGVQTDPVSFHNRTVGATNLEILRMYLGADLPEETLRAYSLEKETRYRATYSDAIQPIPGLVEYIRRARGQGIALAIATSAGRQNIDFVLQRIGLEDAFQVIVGSEDIRHGKPNPEIFLTALERLGLPAAQCLAYEDSRGGIASAAAAGLPVIAITTGLSDQQALDLPGVRLAVKDYTSLDVQQALKFIPGGSEFQ